MRSLNLLMIEDNDEHAQIVRRYLSRAEGFNVHLHRETLLSSGISELKKSGYDAVLLDLRLPDSELHETLPIAVKSSDRIPIIVLSSLEDRESAIKAVQEGASDYLCKAGLSSELLIRTVLNSMQRKETEAQLRLQSSFNQTLYELGQIALKGSSLGDLRSRIRDYLHKGMDVAYVEFLQNVKVDTSLLLSEKESHNDGSPSILMDLDTIGLSEVRSRISDLGFISGLNILVKEKDSQTGYLLILAYSLEQREFTYQESVFVQAMANIYSAAMERKNLQDQLQGKIKALNDANQKKDDFLATLSHELRTPLNIISGYLEVIRNLAPTSKEFSQSFDKIEENVKAETKLISDILDLSRIITGKMTISPEKFELDQLIKSTVEAIGFAASAKKIKVKLNLDSSVGSFFGDANRIRQAMWNLLSNAVKFTPNQGEIAVYGGFEESSFAFSVQDTGRGISKENIPHVFDRFWQEDSSMSRSYMGLGLGLGIVRHIIELHGGEVQVSSGGRNQGSLFRFTIPIPSLIVRKESTEALPMPKFQFHSLQGLDILAIDDSEDTLALMKLLLTKEGARVSCASSPREGLQAAKDHKYDVVLSDIGMPEVNGYELMKALRTWEKENDKDPTPAIALTAYAASDDISKAIEAGFQLHVPKPMNIKTLKEQIRMAIESAQLRT